MTTLSTTDAVTSTVIDATAYNNNLTAIKTVVNGNIDNTNVNAAAAIDVSKLAGSYASYVPAFAASGSALGNGTISGAYLQIGKFVNGHINMVGGSSTNWGSSAFTFTLPVNPAAACQTYGHPLGSAVAFDSSSIAVVYPFHVIYWANPNIVALIIPPGSASETVTATLPITFATSDTININFSYHTA